MTDQFGDARLEELKLLAEISCRGGVTKSPKEGPEREMVFFLVRNGFITAFDLHWRDPGGALSIGIPGDNPLERQIEEWRVRSMSDVLSGQSVSLRMTHKGRVRLSELKQALRTGRLREQFGILLDARHLETDLQIAVLDAGEKTPLSVGFLEMNGLKQINDTFGHEAGDSAVRLYFQAVAAAVADRGEAYRIGGDEVFAILPFHDSDKAKDRLEKACRLAMGEKLEFDGRKLPPLSLAVGVVTTADPRAELKELVRSAEGAMYQAKKESHKRESPCPSFIAVEKDLIEVPL